MAKVIQQKFANGELESVDSMLKRFKRQVLADGTMQDLEKHEYFVAKSLKRKLKSKAARLRELRNNKD